MTVFPLVLAAYWRRRGLGTVFGLALLWGAHVLDTRFGIGWPEAKHRGYGACDAEGFDIDGRVLLEEGLVGCTVKVVLQGLLSGEVGFAITYGV